MTIKRNFSCGHIGPICLVLAPLLNASVPAFAQTVTDRVLSDIRAESTGACTTLTINFNIRVQPLSSFPTSGRELHIRIQPLDTLASRPLNEALRTPTSVPELQSVAFEGDNAAGPTLSFFFTRDMQFEVTAGAQPQQLVVRLNSPGAPCATDSASAKVQAVSEGQAFALNLRSSLTDATALTAEQAKALEGATVYESQFEKDSQNWKRLRVGFYATQQEAAAARTKLLPYFPDAWIVKVTPEERQQAKSSQIGRAGSTPKSSNAPASSVSAAESVRLVADAEQAIKDGNLDRAISLLTNAVQQPEDANTPRAVELLGLTRERKGQLAHARAQYQDYLQRFPNADGADRVRQRLSALDAAASQGGSPQQLRAPTASAGTSGWKWGARGSFSQFYFRDQGRTSTLTTSSTLGAEVDNSVNVNQLLTNADVTLSGGNDRRQFQIRAAGSYTQNFGTSASITTINNGSEIKTYSSRPGGGIEALTALYLDYAESELNTQLRIGRQTKNSQGVLGRFDGALLGWQATPKIRLNLVGGFPVLSSRQMSVLDDRPFYGVGLDFGAKRSPLQTTIYWYDQRARGGFIDRRSVGIEARFLKKRFNAYTMLDYDVKFNTVNLALSSLNYNFEDGANLSLVADYRKSPLLTTTNATIGQFNTLTNLPFGGLAELRPFFTDPQIYQMARDRTLTAKSVTATYSRPITRKLQMSADVSVTNTGGTRGTPATAGTMEIIGMPGIGTETYYGMQLIGSELLMANDIYIASGRYADTSNANIWTGDFNARLPLTSRLRFSPRVRYGIRDGKITSATPVPGKFTQFQPTLRINYYPIKHSEMELEFGGNFTHQTIWNTGTLGFDKVTESGWVLSAGYRLDF